MFRYSIIILFTIQLFNKEKNKFQVSQPGTICEPSTLAYNINAIMSEVDVSLVHNTAQRILELLTDTDRLTAIGLAGRG